MGDEAQSDKNGIFTVRIIIIGGFAWMGTVLQPIVTDALRSLLRGERIEAFISGLLLGGAIVLAVVSILYLVVTVLRKGLKSRRPLYRRDMEDAIEQYLIDDIIDVIKDGLEGTVYDAEMDSEEHFTVTKRQWKWKYWEERGKLIGDIVLALSLGFLLAIIVNPSSVHSALWVVSVAFLIILVLTIYTRLLTTPS